MHYDLLNKVDMKTRTEIWSCQTMVIVTLLIITNGCRKVVQKEQQIPTVTTNVVSDITSASAICGGNVISCGGNTWVNRGICWSDIITEPTIADNPRWADSGSQTGSFSTLLDYLTPGTSYFVRAYADNDAGIGYGSVIDFTTTGSVVGDIVFNPDLEYGSLTDIDGNAYKTIKIASQTWLAENLKTSKYNDGTDIPLVTALADWINLATPAYCWYYNDEAKYKNNYGALYNWHAVNTGKLCPIGWHVPTDTEFKTLIAYSGGDSVAGRQLKETGVTHWIMTSTGVSNSSGFTALPGGTRWGAKSDPISYFKDLGYIGYFWSTTDYSDPGSGPPGAYSWSFYWSTEACYKEGYTKAQGLSIRCVQN
jgi:uncharacterized protein (TIGR02145 family)